MSARAAAVGAVLLVCLECDHAWEVAPDDMVGEAAAAGSTDCAGCGGWTWIGELTAAVSGCGAQMEFARQAQRELAEDSGTAQGGFGNQAAIGPIAVGLDRLSGVRRMAR